MTKLPAAPSDPGGLFGVGAVTALCLVAGGCEPPWHPIPTFDEETTGTDTGGSDDGTATAATGTTGTTGTSSGSTTQGDDTENMTEETGDPATPPEILEVSLSPQPMLHHGPIAAEVEAIAASGVRLLLEDGSTHELAVDAGDPELFYGIIPALSGAMNGEHLAYLTPWAATPEGETVDGATVEVPYTLALPEPGSELLWESGDLIGSGEVAGLVYTADGEVIELGTQTAGGKSRCYLRRRDQGGGWKLNDLRELLPGEECKATALALAPTGAIIVLTQRQTQEGLRWWLGELSSWGAIPTHRMLGGEGEEATSLAVHDSGRLAVCGSVPTVYGDERDAAAWLVYPDALGERRTFDYQPGVLPPHSFAETTRACAFAGDTLVLVGDAFGRHDQDNTKRQRHFLLEHGTLTKDSTWTVDDGALSPQSAATAIAIDDLGRAYVGGYTCGSKCDQQPVAELRLHSPGGTLIWQSAIGTVPTPQWAPQALAWSPAGYAVVALGGNKGAELAFTVRAYSPEQIAPLWIYQRSDQPFLNFARAIATGPYGQIVAGGLGLTSYPAVVYLAG